MFVKGLGTGNGVPLKQQSMFRFSVCKQVWVSEGQADAVIQVRGDSGTPKSGGVQVAAHDGGSEEAAKISLIC